MNITGIIIGTATFLIIGICHPLVIKAEYYFGRIAWIGFLIAGIALAAFSLFTKGTLSILLGAGAFSFFWGILEMFEQEKRVLKGWFPENPKRHDYYQAKRDQIDNK